MEFNFTVYVEPDNEVESYRTLKEAGDLAATIQSGSCGEPENAYVVGDNAEGKALTYIPVQVNHGEWRLQGPGGQLTPDLLEIMTLENSASGEEFGQMVEGVLNTYG